MLLSVWLPLSFNIPLTYFVSDVATFDKLLHANRNCLLSLKDLLSISPKASFYGRQAQLPYISSQAASKATAWCFLASVWLTWDKIIFTLFTDDWMCSCLGFAVQGWTLVWGHCIEYIDWAPNRRFAGSVGAWFSSGRCGQTSIEMPSSRRSFKNRGWATAHLSLDPLVYVLVLSFWSSWYKIVLLIIILFEFTELIRHIIWI